METWLDEANVRASSIVAAKNDEIDKELELRLHLHEPRMKRAEMDVHNVRAGKKKGNLAFMSKIWNQFKRKKILKS